MHIIRTSFTFGVLLIFTFIIGFSQSKTNVVDIYQLKDFPEPINNEIKLDPSKVYIIHGAIDISPNYIIMDGAGVQGVNPDKDGIISSCKGGILRSRNANVYLEKLFVLCAGKETSGYDFRDDSHAFYCNIFPGCTVIEAKGIMSQGVGQIIGFNTTCIDLAYWNTKKGLRVGGTASKFTLVYTYVTGIANGAAITFLSDAIIRDVVLDGNYFVYGGAEGIKVQLGAQINEGKMTKNLFKGQAKYLSGFDSYTPGWEMVSNGQGIPDSRARAAYYMNDNDVYTEFISSSVFKKIEGNTTTMVKNKFNDIQNNRLIYSGKKKITADVVATVTGISGIEGGNYSIALLKNGEELILPKASTYNVSKDQAFQLRLDAQVSFNKGDYVEVGLQVPNNSLNEPILIKDLNLKLIQQY